MGAAVDRARVRGLTAQPHEHPLVRLGGGATVRRGQAGIVHEDDLVRIVAAHERSGAVVGDIQAAHLDLGMARDEADRDRDDGQDAHQESSALANWPRTRALSK